MLHLRKKKKRPLIKSMFETDEEPPQNNKTMLTMLQWPSNTNERSVSTEPMLLHCLSYCFSPYYRDIIFFIVISVRTLTSPARILSFLLLQPSLPVRYILAWDHQSGRESHIYQFMTYDYLQRNLYYKNIIYTSFKFTTVDAL